MTELMERGSLESQLYSPDGSVRGDYAWSRRGAKILLDAAKGLRYLHTLQPSGSSGTSFTFQAASSDRTPLCVEDPTLPGVTGDLSMDHGGAVGRLGHALVPTLREGARLCGRDVVVAADRPMA